MSNICKITSDGYIVAAEQSAQQIVFVTVNGVPTGAVSYSNLVMLPKIIKCRPILGRKLSTYTTSSYVTLVYWSPYYAWFRIEESALTHNTTIFVNTVADSNNTDGSWYFGNIILPYNPASVKQTNAAHITEVTTGNKYDYAMLISFGRKAKVITFTGTIAKYKTVGDQYNVPLTNAELEASFITTLDNYTYQEIPVRGPYNRHLYDAIVAQFESEEKGLYGFTYTLQLKRGGFVVQVTGG